MASLVHLSPGDKIKYNDKRYLYAVLTKQGAQRLFPQAKLQQKLALKITEIDIDSQDEVGSYEEEYPLDEVHLAVRDYITSFALGQG